MRAGTAATAEAADKSQQSPNKPWTTSSGEIDAVKLDWKMEKPPEEGKYDPMRVQVMLSVI